MAKKVVIPPHIKPKLSVYTRCGPGHGTDIEVFCGPYIFVATVPGIKLSQLQAAALWGRRPSMFKRIE